MVIADEATVQDPAALLALTERSGATVMQATPTLWQALLAEAPRGPSRLRMLVGGEALPGTLAEAMCGCGRDVTNLYGPTETTIWSTVADVSAHPGTPPIGAPIWNTQVYVLDAGLQPVPPGVAGQPAADAGLRAEGHAPPAVPPTLLHPTVPLRASPAAQRRAPDRV